MSKPLTDVIIQSDIQDFGYFTQIQVLRKVLIRAVLDLPMDNLTGHIIMAARNIIKGYSMELLTIVTLLALLEFVWLGTRVGMARGKFGVTAPATTGNEEFERHYRVHYNTLEQLVLFIPSLWAFGYYVGQFWAAGLGAIYLIGRMIYALAYVKDPASRGPGMLLSVIPCYVMLLGGLAAAAWQHLTA